MLTFEESTNDLSITSDGNSSFSDIKFTSAKCGQRKLVATSSTLVEENISDLSTAFDCNFSLSDLKTPSRSGERRLLANHNVSLEALQRAVRNARVLNLPVGED